MDQHEYAIFERRVKAVNTATRMCWIPVDFKTYTINVGIQIKNEQDVENLSMLDLSKSLDNISQNVVQYNILELIMISDKLYGEIVNYYTTHNVNIEIVNLNQPVLSTNYLNPPL